LKLQKVTENVYAIVGEPGNRTAGNLGNNAIFGFVITTEGVVLIDSGVYIFAGTSTGVLYFPRSDKKAVRESLHKICE